MDKDRSTAMSGNHDGSPPREDLLEVRNVTKDYVVKSRDFVRRQSNLLRALDEVSLNLKAANTLGVVGESGSGKTTLAKIIALLETPTQGEVLFEGRKITSFDQREVKSFRRQVQFVFQDPYSSLPARMSVATLMAEPLAIHGIGTSRERTEKAAELLERVGLDRADLSRYPHNFSGGQRQRISIARALMLQPRLLLCDEPVSALDVSIQAQILKLLLELQQDFSLSYLVISHDLRVVRFLCDDLAVMYLGRIVEQGNARSVFARPAHPYTAALIKSIPPQSVVRNQRVELSHLPGEVPSPLSRPSGCHFHPRCPLRAQLGKEDASRCDHERPALRPVTNGRTSACHFAERLLEQEELAQGGNR
jgi:oligopeptide/dipeptide ABC transporter ATP-binding protein